MIHLRVTILQMKARQLGDVSTGTVLADTLFDEADGDPCVNEILPSTSKAGKDKRDYDVQKRLGLESLF